MLYTYIAAKGVDIFGSFKNRKISNDQRDAKNITVY